MAKRLKDQIGIFPMSQVAPPLSHKPKMLTMVEGLPVIEWHWQRHDQVCLAYARGNSMLTHKKMIL